MSMVKKNQHTCTLASFIPMMGILGMAKLPEHQGRRGSTQRCWRLWRGVSRAARRAAYPRVHPYMVNIAHRGGKKEVSLGGCLQSGFLVACSRTRRCWHGEVGILLDLSRNGVIHACQALMYVHASENRTHCWQGMRHLSDTNSHNNWHAHLQTYMVWWFACHTLLVRVKPEPHSHIKRWDCHLGCCTLCVV